MAKRVVDLLEMAKVEKQEGQAPFWHRRAGLLEKEGIQYLEQMPPVPESRQIIGHRLTVALLGESPQSPDRQGQSNAYHNQRRRG